MPHPTQRKHQSDPARGLVGSYSWDLADDSWTWSPELYNIHGLPSDVVPTTELLLSLKHHEDRGYVIDVIADAHRSGGPFSCQHRIRRADDHTVRSVVVVGEVDHDDHGHARAMRGFFADVTDAPGGLGGDTVEAEKARLRCRLGELRAECAHPLPRRGSTTPALKAGDRARLGSVLAFTYDIDLAARGAFTRDLGIAVASVGGPLYLDFADVEFIDVAGVDLLVQAADDLPADRLMVLLQPCPSLRTILDLFYPAPPDNLILRAALSPEDS